MTLNKSALLGQRGEAIAQEIYIQRGFNIVSQNYFNRYGKRLGEIDFIAQKNRALHFVEVKTRSSKRFGSAAEAITWYKKTRLLRAVHIFLLRFREFSHDQVHLDVVTVEFHQFDKPRIRVKIYSDAIDGIY